jgi:hypothetical protein
VTINRRAIFLFVLIALFMMLIPSVTFAQDEIRVTGIRLNQTELVMIPGQQLQISATVYPTNATDRRVEWRNSNPAVVSLTVSGHDVLINSLAAGESVITAVTRDKGYLINCYVTVIIPVRSVGIERETITLSPGDTHQLEAWVEPRDANEQGLIWESSDYAVATVDQEGNVKAVREGEARIIARANEDNAINAYATITVLNGEAVIIGETEDTSSSPDQSEIIEETILEEQNSSDSVNYLLWALAGVLLVALAIFLYMRVISPRQPVSAPTPILASGSNAGLPVLVGVSGLYSGHKIALNTGPVIIGRDPALARVVYPQDHDQISRRHCTVYYDQASQQIIVEDNSSNGTFLANGQRLQPNIKHYLQPGDTLTLAQTDETFAIELE